MISIIICSRTQVLSKDLSENIKNTVGCDYELVVIDNSENIYSIFEAYNLGIEQSKGEYLCFAHDDILFHTPGWGETIKCIFSEDHSIGLIGVAGAKFKTKAPSPWWNTPENQKVMNIIQHFGNGTVETESFGFKNKTWQEVVTIDGLFMVLRKQTSIVFNPKMQGFHNYDLNICFECKQKGYKIVVTSEILIEHFSTGSINESWVESAFKIHNTYKGILPLSVSLNKKNNKFEVENSKRYIKRCLKYKKNKMAFSVWRGFFLMSPLSKYHFTFWKKMAINQFFHS